MRDSWRASIPKKSQTKLVISGIYKFSRNPAFLGFNLQYTGVLLLYFNPWTVLFLRQYRVFGFGLWAVCLKSTGKMIGDCGLTLKTVNGTILPEIGYHIARRHQRRGYAKEAVQAVRRKTVALQ